MGQECSPAVVGAAVAAEVGRTRARLRPVAMHTHKKMERGGGGRGEEGMRRGRRGEEGMRRGRRWEEGMRRGRSGRVPS
eukprot:248417-Chlamydomonas_euryale.AAC.1